MSGGDQGVRRPSANGRSSPGRGTNEAERNDASPSRSGQPAERNARSVIDLAFIERYVREYGGGATD